MSAQYSARSSHGHSNRKLRRMSSDLVVGLVGIVIVAALLVMGVNYTIATQKADRTLRQAADQYLSYLTRSLELPVWSMDDSTVMQIGDAFMTSDLFSLLEIISDEHKERYIYSKMKTDDDEMIMREGKLTHEGKIMGSVRLGLSKKLVRDEMRRQLYSSLWITTAIVLVMVAATLFMLRQFVRKPLQLLMDVAGDLARRNYDSRKENIKHYEMAMVYDQLISMAGRVKGREASLEEANEKLRQEIRRRETSERELRHLRNYLSNIIDSMPSALVGVDVDGRVTQWNKTVARATGIAAGEAQGKLLTNLMPWMVSEMGQIEESIRTKQIRKDAKKSRFREDGPCHEDITIYPLVTNGSEGAVIRIDDVSEMVRMEEMMVQNEKMLSVGGLAAGMAHEINNPLAGMLQTTQVMESRLSANFDIPANRKAAEAAGTTMEAIQNFMEARGILRMLATLTQSGKRAADIVNNMLSFARKGDSRISTHPIEQLLDKALELAATDYDLKRQYDFKMIEIAREYTPHLPEVPCQAAKIQQVLLNILRNGAQAMQEAGTESPRVIVRTNLAKEGEMVCLEIEDNGPGMDEKTRKRVFEPFFTTKPTGMGTGLGLSVSYFIITENHGGEMTVESRPEAGTKFIIRLPAGGKGSDKIRERNLQ